MNYNPQPVDKPVDNGSSQNLGEALKTV